MKIAGKEPSRISRKGKEGVASGIDAIMDHVEKSENFEFVRIMEQYSKMDAATVEKFLEYAEKL